VIFTRTIAVPWDDIDVGGCADNEAPNWATLIIAGPTKRRDSRGNASLEWTVTAHCKPALKVSDTDDTPHPPSTGWRTS
jgi:hypothetical protein